MIFRRLSKRVLAAALSAVIVLAAMPAGAFVASATNRSEPMQIGVISDIHYFPDSLTGNNCEAFTELCNSNARQYSESDELLTTSLNAMAKHANENGMKYVFFSGDMSKDGEYEGHEAMAQQLEQFERDTGIQVVVINGNHDVNNASAETFVNGRSEQGTTTSPEQFRELYRNLGYDLACNTYTPPEGTKAGMLSYSARLEGGYRLIAIDTCKYSSDATSDGANQHETGGNITDDLMQWILGEVADAKRCGEEVIGLCHHNIVPHYDIEEAVLQGFDIDNWLETSETLADAGMHYVITGHVHMSDISSHVSDKGETIYDITTSSLCGYPNTFREVRFEEGAEGLKADVDTLDIDCEENVVVEGVTYEKPYKYSHSFGMTYGDEGIAQFGIDMASYMVEGLFEDARNAGGIMALLDEYGIDLEQVYSNLIGEGVKLGGINIFTAENLMSFTEDLAAQIDEKYINDYDRVALLIANSVDKIMSIKVSDVPCTKYIDTLGFGDPNKAGTLEDFAMTMVAGYSNGDEDISNDAFSQSVLDNIENGDFAENLLNVVIEVVVGDILESEILSQLDVHLSSLFVSKFTKNTVGALLDFLLNIVLGGDTSYINLVNFVFKLGILPYGSVNNVLDFYMDEYLTESQFDSLGTTMAWMTGSFLKDNNPGQCMDNDVTLCYSGPVEVVPTAKDYRLPSIVATTFGEDSSTDWNVSWYTKYSVTGTDIEIVPYSENPVFSGEPTTAACIKATTEKVDRQYPGVDIGITGFLMYTEHLIRHTIEITGLEPGHKYCYRIGDASKGWWSDAGIIEAADGSGSVSFFHITDPQSQSEKQYTSGWKTTISTAFDMFPESKLIIDTGDSVDSGTNVHQWQWFFDTASDTLMDTVIMPATGNHEDNGEAVTTNFFLSNLPEQDTETGVYYSFDYNNAHFMVLNTNDLDDDDAISQEQIEWLKADAQASDAQWKILALHKAPYSNGSHFDDDDVIQIRKVLSTLMPELGIDVVLQGHDHVYLRTGVMSNNAVVETEQKEITYGGRDYSAYVKPEGTIYSIPATSGVKYYTPKDASETNELFPQAASIVETESSVFTAYHIEDNVLYYDAYTVEDGEATRIDSFAIEKEKVEKPAVNIEYNNNIDENIQTLSFISDNNIAVDAGTERNPQTGDTAILLMATVPIIMASATYIFAARRRKKANAE